MNSSSYSEILKDMMDVFHTFSSELLKKANVDRSYKMYVTEKKNGNKYSVLYKKTSYAARGYRSNINAGDCVMVCAPCGDWSELYII